MCIRGVLEEVDEQYLPSAGVPGDQNFSHLSDDKQSQVREICNSDVFLEKILGGRILMNMALLKKVLL